jgi:hypothetical protein
MKPAFILTLICYAIGMTFAAWFFTGCAHGVEKEVAEVKRQLFNLEYQVDFFRFDETVEICDQRYEICKLKGRQGCEAKQEQCTIEAWRAFKEVREAKEKR